MNLHTEFDEYGLESGIKYAKEHIGNRWNDAAQTVLSVALSDKQNLPALNIQENPVPFKKYIQRWADSYFRGYDSRPSMKTGNPGATAPDAIIGYLLNARLPDLQSDTIKQIVEGHSLLMSIENLVGALLEEYLSVKLAQDGWCCCWGTTMVAIDFCKSDGSLLQVKTSDNSENSSSRRVRNGTSIRVWQRRNSKKADTYYWNELNDKLGRNDLSEDDFKAFAVRTVQENPGCLHIADNHILRNTK